MNKLMSIPLILIMTLLWSCASPPDFSYGMTTIAMPDGQKVYFKRKVGLLDHDVWVISPSNDICNVPNPETDYCFRQMGPIDPLYQIQGDNLIIFIRGSAAEPPKSGKFPITLIQKEVTPIDYLKMEKDPGRLGLNRLNVQVDESLKCNH